MTTVEVRLAVPGSGHETAGEEGSAQRETCNGSSSAISLKVALSPDGVCRVENLMSYLGEALE